MIIREAPSEEERRRLRMLHILDYSCLGLAVLIVILTVLGSVYSMGGAQVLGTVLVLGAVLNLGLAARAAAAHLKIASWGALGLMAICIGGFLYLVLYR